VAWLECALAQCARGENVEMIRMAAAAFFVATHRRVFAVSTPMSAAAAFLVS
jgi:hypothetical protein